jgi:hypothetical protein
MTLSQLGIGIFAVSFLSVGTMTLFWPHIARENAQTRHLAKVADRERRGQDAFFEEQRTLEAYAPPESMWRHRVKGR